MAKKRNRRGNSQLPKQRNFKEIEYIIDDFLIPKMTNHPKEKRFKPILFVIKTAMIKGPFIQKNKKSKEPRINWISWVFKNHDDFLTKLEIAFMKQNLKTENFIISIEETKISIQEIDWLNIPHVESEAMSNDDALLVRSAGS